MSERSQHEPPDSRYALVMEVDRRLRELSWIGDEFVDQLCQLENRDALRPLLIHAERRFRIWRERTEDLLSDS